MNRRVPQPRMDAARRDPERHGFWPAFAVALLALFLIAAGAQRSTGVGTVDGRAARETQLIKAFAVGGVQFADRVAVSEPPVPTGDPMIDAEAFARWDREQAAAEAPAWRVRVDPSAKTPCPT
jgi:hypothetical protein